MTFATSYLTPAQLRLIPNDYDLTRYSDAQLQSILDRASGVANSIMRQSYLAQRRTVRLYGEGRSSLSLHRRPLLWIERVQFTYPFQPLYALPIGSMLIDYDRGEIVEFYPLALSGVGYTSVFPERVPVDVTLAWGYGYGPIAAPTFTVASATGLYGGGLAAGQYSVVVTARTPAGETLGVAQQVACTGGAISVAITPVLGAANYGVYVAPAGGTPALVTELSPPLDIADTLYCTIATLTPTLGVAIVSAPTVDTSALVTPTAIVEAVRLIALGSIFEQNNLSNRGIARTESGRKSIQWRSTEGSSGKGIPLYYDQASEWLSPFVLNEVF